MINSDDFSKRLQKVIDYYGESASSFSDKIGVQRSSISHILSGRNKPSLDFVLKILGTYPEVELYWLLNGKGNFPNVESVNKEEVAHKKESKITKVSSVLSNETKSIDKIVIFYTDGTFKNYQPN
ncbi:Helix-turn-helix [Flavobacteriaceae bacterium MAR_2010_188]|nr:Helix-turn-helix [Flavobacteriaceae bacterium MAR_2010_188]